MIRLSVDATPLCREADPEIWFPEATPGHTKFHTEYGQELVYNTVTALESCARCPMQAQCLQFAVDQKEIYGIWGGTFAHERAEAAELPAGQLHGTPYYTKLRSEVLKKNARLVCPPIPERKSEYVPMREFLPVAWAQQPLSESEFQDEEPLNL